MTNVSIIRVSATQRRRRLIFSPAQRLFLPISKLILTHPDLQTGYGAVANDDTSEVLIEGCVASHVWLLARHGTRYPSSQANHPHNCLAMIPTILRQAMVPMRKLLPKIQEQVLGNHKAGRGDSKRRGQPVDQAATLPPCHLAGHLCDQDLENLRAWRFQVGPRQDKRLTRFDR